MQDIIGHGGGKGGGSSHTHYEAPDSLHSISYARVLDLVSEGEILGLAEGLQSVYLNNTPVQNADGTSNFQGVTVDFRTGTQDQDYIPGFPDVENEISVGVELKYGTPWVRAISNTALSAVRITLGVDQLYKANTDNGDIGGSIVNYQIELSTDGAAYQVVLSNSFNGKTMSAYQRSARIDLPRASTGWQIRVTRLTQNSTVVSVVDKTNIVSFTEVIDAKLRYPMSAIVGIQVDAKQFQSVPTRSFDLFGRIIQVPSNYDPRTRTYTGTWAGTFKPSWSDNPAWVFRDLALNDRYGLGNRIAAAQLDKWSLYKIARYCDELVPDGQGGTEPRFTCNLYLQTRKQAYAVLQDIASIFRGISYWGAGTIMASADMPADPVYVFTAANVIGGKFTRTGTKKTTRYTVALVTWNDPADGYKPKAEYVEDREGIARYGIQQLDLTAFGCASQGQAHRAGLWALATSRLETEGISFDVGMDGAIALPGQIVRIADPSRMGRRVGGRVRAVAGRTITLDKAPTIKAGDRLTVILPAGASETRTVTAVSGDAVTVDSDWSAAPRAQSVWSVDSDELSAPLFRVLSVTEKDSITFTITAVQHEPGKYDFVENGTAITPRTQTALDVTRQAPPVSVTLTGYTVSLADVQKLALQVSCAPVVGAVAYEGAYRRGNDNWIAIPRQVEPTMSVLDVLAGTYTAKMWAVNSVGVTSIETMSTAVDVAADGVSKSAAVLLSADAPYFHTNQGGSTDPAVITFTASLIALSGPVAWSCVGGTLSNKTDTTAQLTFANASASSVTVTATVTAFGRSYSQSIKITKVQDGAPGSQGDPGIKTGIARLYQWSAATPSKPSGTSTFTWASVSNSAYTASDGWSATVPANPGTPAIRLYVASVSLSAAAAVTTSSVSYTSAPVEAWSQNGNNGSAGSAGANGLQSATATVYQWAATIPAGPVGSATYTWASRDFGAAPSGWSLTPGTSPSAGMTLWAAAVQFTDSAANQTTAFNWSSAAITAAGYAGLNGTGAAYVSVSNNGQVFSRATSAASFAPASLTLTATPVGGAATYQWQYWAGSAWVNVVANGAAATYVVASGDFTDSRTYRVQATIGGTVYTDEVTLVQVTGGKDGANGSNGVNAITGFLTNEATALPATSAGVVADFSPASGIFKVFDGITDKTGASAAYSVASQTGCTVAITTAGAYSVSAMSADSATAVLQAVYGGVTIQKTLTLAKARAGTNGSGAAYVVASTTAQVFSRATSAGTFSPTSLTLTATPYGGSATYQWQYWTGSAWSSIAGATAATYVVASGDFTDARTYRVQATIAGVVYTDEITLVQVTGGSNGSNGANGTNAITGFLTNESTALPATNAGVVGDFSPAGGTFRVYDGIADKTGASVTYSVAAQTGCAVSINAAGAYSVSAMSADAATATLQAVYGGVTIQKVLTLAKARAGADGPKGDTGQGGQTGQAGASYVTAYCASATGSATSAPASTVGKTSLPAANSGGITGAWSATVPTLAAGQYLYQSDGIYDPATGLVTWSTPYWSSLKVASLSAITANMGAITAGSMDIGSGATSWHVDASGNQWAGAATYAAAAYQLANTGALTVSALTVKRKSDGAVILTSDGLTAAGAAPGTLNSDLGPAISAAATTATGAGFSGTVGGDNLAQNSSFERSSDGNLADGYAVYNNAGNAEPTVASLSPAGQGRAGGKAQVIQWTGSHNYSKGISGSICRGGWIPGKTYMISIWAKTTNVSGQANLFLGWNTTPTVVTEVQNPIINGEWQRYVFRIVWGGSVEAGGVGYISIATGNGGGNIWFDDLMVVEGDVMPAYYQSAWEASTTAQWALVDGPNKPQDNATVGAPIGTLVGGTFAQIVETNSYAGKAASDALPDKLSKTAANILQAPITLQSAGAIASGTITTDGAGNRTGGYGTLMSPTGLVHYTSDGNPAVTLGANGVAVKADVSGSTGTFGAVRIGVSMALQATAYNNDPGIFFGLVNGVAKGSFVAGGSKILIDPSASQPIQLVNVGLAQSPLPVSITTTGGNLTTTYSRNASAASTVVGYVNVSGGSGNYTYNWSVTADGYACWTTNPAGSNCAGVMKGPGIALPDGVGFTLVCTVTDQNTGRTGQATFSPTIIFS